jgi:uncharacterized membrane protein
MAQQNQTKSFTNFIDTSDVFNSVSCPANIVSSSNSGWSSLKEQDIKPLNIPVSIVVEEKPKFVELYEKHALINNVSEVELCEIIAELKNPQRMTIKIREINDKDHDALWKFFNQHDTKIQSFIRDSLKNSLDGLFKIGKITYREGCVVVIIIMVPVAATAPAWLPIAGLAIGVAGLALTALINWDKIVSNLKRLKNEVVKVYNKFCSFLSQVQNQFQRWLFGDGEQPAT